MSRSRAHATIDTPYGYKEFASDDRADLHRSGDACNSCRLTITEELEEVAGVREIDVDLDAKRVTVRGDDLDDATLRAAIGEAGYAAA